MFVETKDALKTRCKEILRNGITPSDQIFLKNLILRHPNATEKIGSGIKEFFIYQWPTGYRNKCFAIRRTDGTFSTFSYKECGIAPTTRRHKAVNAFRYAISDQIVAFRNAARDAGADVSHQVDHGTGALAFSAILDEFCSRRGIDLNTVEVKDVADHGELPKALASDFAQFHGARARLQMISASDNRKQGNGA